MTGLDLLEVLADLAQDHDGPLTVDDLLDAPVVRCGSCGSVVWRGST